MTKQSSLFFKKIIVGYMRLCEAGAGLRDVGANIFEKTNKKRPPPEQNPDVNPVAKMFREICC